MIHQWRDISTPRGAYRRILAGEEPPLTWEPDACPLKAGDEVYVMTTLAVDGTQFPTLWLVVEAIDTTKNGRKEARYDLEDNRPLFVAEGSNHIHGHGYTRSPAMSLDGAEVLDPETYEMIERETMASRLRKAEARAMKDSQDPKRMAKSFTDAVKVALKTLGPDDQRTLMTGLKRVYDEVMDAARVNG